MRLYKYEYNSHNGKHTRSGVFYDIRENRPNGAMLGWLILGKDNDNVFFQPHYPTLDMPICLTEIMEIADEIRGDIKAT